MVAPLTITRFTVPLFSSDYAKINREIAEWNRRARSASISIDDKIAALQSQINSLSTTVGAQTTVGRATNTVYGTVITDELSTAPRVYLTTSVDALIADLQSQIDALTTRVTTLESNQTPQRGNGPPDSTVVARYDGDEYWDLDGGPGTYRWYAAMSEWQSI